LKVEKRRTIIQVENVDCWKSSPNFFGCFWLNSESDAIGYSFIHVISVVQCRWIH